MHSGHPKCTPAAGPARYNRRRWIPAELALYIYSSTINEVSQDNSSYLPSSSLLISNSLLKTSCKSAENIAGDNLPDIDKSVTNMAWYDTQTASVTSIRIHSFRLNHHGIVLQQSAPY